MEKSHNNIQQQLSCCQGKINRSVAGRQPSNLHVFFFFFPQQCIVLIFFGTGLGGSVRVLYIKKHPMTSQKETNKFLPFLGPGLNKYLFSMCCISSMYQMHTLTNQIINSLRADSLISFFFFFFLNEIQSIYQGLFFPVYNSVIFHIFKKLCNNHL